jgi:tetratricopeptide (TPR) repeat protein
MQFYYREAFKATPPEAYETLLLDVMLGDATLFMRADQTEAAWEILAPILNLWETGQPTDFPNYQAGAWGPEAAENLLAQQPDGVAGHYWKALNLSGLADVNRLRGFKLLAQIMDELKRSLALDETYDQAGAHRVLGRIYFEAPGWPVSVGDKEKSLEQLTAAVRLAPDNSTNHLYLAETLLAMGRKAPARGELEKVLQARRHAISPQGLEEDHREAQRLLKKLENPE